MSNISAFQSKFRAQESVAKSPSSKSARRRRKFSCLLCRTKKLRCDRAQPCSNCRKAKSPAACMYVDSPNGSVMECVGSHTQQRLLHLQDMIVEVVQEQAPSMNLEVSDDPSGSLSTDSSVPASVIGHPSLRDNFISNGPTTWTTILDCIQTLVAAARDEDTDSNSSDSDNDSLVELDNEEISIFTITRCPCPQDIFSRLPSRDVLDRHLSRYFRARLATFPTVHVPSFQRMYEKFWQDPTKVPILWSAQLFGILSISVRLGEFMEGSPADAYNTSCIKKDFLTAAAQCLHIGGYARPGPYVIEALLVYAQSKYMAHSEPTKELWILFGIIVRLALQMGYHRDPDSLNGVSIFHGEMRRRVWGVIRQLDLLNCFQMGLPGALQSYQSDVRAPRNLQDVDFDESTQQLPPSRPEVDPTPMLYFVVKVRIMDVFAKIMENQSSFHPSSESQEAKLSVELRQVRGMIPPCFVNKPMAQSFMDAPDVIMMRVNIELLLQKSVCILYRRSMLQPEPRPEVVISCTEASMAMLRLQIVLHQESQPGGQLHQSHWMVSSLSLSDFFLGAIILTLVILKDRILVDSPATQERIALLEKSHQLFSSLGSHSKEAQKIAAGLTVALTRLQRASFPLDIQVDRLPPTKESFHSTTFDQSTATMESLLAADNNFDWGLLDQFLVESEINYA